MAPRLRISGSTIRDEHSREVTLHGINLAADTKFPAKPDIPSHVKEDFFDGDNVSFVGRPFPLSEAHEHFSRLKRWGYNTLRYVFTWECIEHERPGKYDDEFCDFTIEVLRIAKQYGFYVFMDPHQDVWSRFTGGSGAPMWTVYACGFDPRKFHVTQASMVQNTWPDPAKYPKMVWATNYQKLAAQTIFTMFFGGKDFTPNCVIDGKNIQDYLQDHFIAACRYLAQKVHDAGDLEGECVIGHESMNEPNKGHLGWADLSKLSEEQKLKKGNTPTAWQCMLSGLGRAVEVETWDFGNLGPYKSGTQLIDPKGTTAWLDPNTWDDSKYGWTRADSWKLGECVWAQHGVWDSKLDELLQPAYFAKSPATGETIDHEYFTNHYFMHYYRKYRDAIRSVWPESVMFIQPCPFEIPPRIKGTEDDDPNMIFASHFYDGITLIMKKWNRLWNVDVFGVLRGKYLTPAFAIKVGETAIRNCFRDQLAAIRDEGIEYMGEHPCMYTEIGIPYDMDDQNAYKTGDYTSQSAAFDANMFAVEGSNVAGFTWWDYTASNSHKWGDQWNGEDLSIYSRDDKQLPVNPSLENNASQLSLSLNPSSVSYSESAASDSSPKVGREGLRKTLTVDGMSPSRAESATANGDKLGYRAAEAFIRPHPIVTHGKIDSHGFDLRSCTFTLALTAGSATPQDHPTEVFLPEFHFPQQQTQTQASGGRWTITMEDYSPGKDGTVVQQVFRWWHGEGEQKVTIKGVKRNVNGKDASQNVEEDEGYLQQYLNLGKSCSVM